MMNWLQRLRGALAADEQKRPPEPMTEARVDMSLRVFWTKIARHWEMGRIQHVHSDISAIIQQPDFQKNLLERRYFVENLVPDGQQQQHSGASLLALREVLDTLMRMQANEQESKPHE